MYWDQRWILFTKIIAALVSLTASYLLYRGEKKQNKTIELTSMVCHGWPNVWFLS